MEEIIVVPLDGSNLGEVALSYVDDLFGKMSSDVRKEVILLQVLSAFAPVVVCGEACIRVLYTEDEMKKHKEKALRYLKKAGKGLKCKDVTATVKVAGRFSTGRDHQDC